MGSYDLSRFLEAQRGAYESALREITNGQKAAIRSHCGRSAFRARRPDDQACGASPASRKCGFSMRPM